jgi:hypothetical protein
MAFENPLFCHGEIAFGQSEEQHTLGLRLTNFYWQVVKSFFYQYRDNEGLAFA